MFGNPNQAFEYFSDSDAITCHATAAITGKRFVKVVAGGKEQVPYIAPCGAGERPFGVAAFDVASGGKVTVIRKGVVSVTAGTALTAPLAIASGADGQAVAVGAAPAVAYGDIYSDVTVGSDAPVVLSL